MQRFLVAVSSIFVAVSLAAVEPQQWRVDSTEDFLGGEIDGFAISSRGELIPSDQASRIAELPDPFVLCQTEDEKGRRFFGTGNDGNVYRLAGGKLDVLFKAPEPEVYSVAWSSGYLWVATSPHGKLYRVDGTTGESKAWFDPEDAYIWAVEPASDGSIFLTTGLPGRLYRVSGEAKGSIWFEAPEAHLRSIAVRNDGSLLVGGSGQGRIYEVRGEKRVRAIFDSDLQEIATIHVSSDGTAWAAGVANVLPQSAPTQAPGQAQQQASQASGDSGQDTSGQQASAAVDFTFSFDNGNMSSGGSGSSELYRIAPDGYTERVWKFDKEMIYGIGPAQAGGLYLSTGPQGRIYEFDRGEVSLVNSLPEKQVVSISPDGAVVTTTNSGAVYRLDRTGKKRAEFRSSVKDTGSFSRFGHYEIDGEDLESSKMKISFRTGNSATPDDTWSDWAERQGASGQAGVPAARYVQWKLAIDNPGRGARVDSVSLVFVNRNAAPTIESLSVNDPGVIFLTTGYPAAPQVVEATNPDEYGIFTSLGSSQSSQRSDPGKRFYRKGYQTFNWRARDPNGDNLEYDLSFRRVGETEWLLFRKGITDIQFNFDTSQLPDGEYEIRLVASDRSDNREAALEDVKEGLRFLVDNTPPSIETMSKGDDVIITVRDSSSAVTKVEYAVNAAEWILLEAEDGISDSRSETFRVPKSEAEGRFVTIRAVDSAFNVSTATIPGQR